jgi:hypothetical protein
MDRSRGKSDFEITMAARRQTLSGRRSHR